MVSYQEYIKELKEKIPTLSDESLQEHWYYFKNQLFTDGLKLIEAEMKKRNLKLKQEFI